MKSPKKLAEELVVDFIEMLPNGIDKIGYDYKSQYEVAKIQAKYSCDIIKYAFKVDGDIFNYWQEVKQEIELL
jgi:hypothetical protein